MQKATSRVKQYKAVDSIVRVAKLPRKNKPARPSEPMFLFPHKKLFEYIFFQKLALPKKVSVFAAIAGLLIAFGGGMWATLSTDKSQAGNQPQVLGDYTKAPSLPPPAGIPVAGADLQAQANSKVSNDVLFNTPIRYLQTYLANVAEPDIIAKRTADLKKYLQDMRSPFADSAETIATQPHWKLILAIAFAESTMGKNCADNNCSNIGVKPGHPAWRRYSSYNSWVVDFNRLLDKKYKDDTLEQMCGVYVKPCNPNWLLATRQVLDSLKERGIE